MLGKLMSSVCVFSFFSFWAYCTFKNKIFNLTNLSKFELFLLPHRFGARWNVAKRIWTGRWSLFRERAWASLLFTTSPPKLGSWWTGPWLNRKLGWGRKWWTCVRERAWPKTRTFARQEKPSRKSFRAISLPVMLDRLVFVIVAVTA